MEEPRVLIALLVTLLACEGALDGQTRFSDPGDPRRCLRWLEVCCSPFELWRSL